MSLMANVGSDSLFVYTPVSSATDVKRAGVSDTSSNNPAEQQPQKYENNTAKGYKNEPDENITGEKLLSSMPMKKDGDKAEKTDKTDKSADNLSEEEKDQVEELKKRDAEVKAHEQAHMAAGGSYVKGGASYEYQAGPDGGRYAVGGEVQIDSSPVKGDPQATIAKAQTIAAAALAPAEPSGQDRAVAAQANKMMAQAQAELMQKNSGGKTENDDESGNELITVNAPKNEKTKTDASNDTITDPTTKNGNTETNSARGVITDTAPKNEKTAANDPFQLINLIDMTA